MLRATTAMSVMLTLGLLGATCPVRAEAAAKSVDLQVWAIRATTKNSDISPELKSIADKLKRQFKYTGFKLEKKSTGKAAVGKSFTASLIGGFKAKVTPKRHDGKQVQLTVEVHKGKKRVLSATVTLKAGQFQLFGGWKLNSSDALIMAVSGR